MPYPSIATQVHQPLDIHRYFAPQIAFHGELCNCRSDFIDLFFGQILHLVR